MPTCLFRRNYRGFRGGHLKVWDYYCHVRGSAYLPQVYFTPSSVWDRGNPWNGVSPPPLSVWEPESADVLFVAGRDWEAVPEGIGVPVINLIQGMGHAEPGAPRRAFLARRAVRICVSDAVAEVIRSTGEVNGPILTIPNGLDADSLPPPAPVRDIPVLIAGLKDPLLATRLSESAGAAGIPNVCLTRALPRRAFLDLLGRAEVAVLLPGRMEGFFLPALEAMAMGALVVCPDCLGNRGFCHDGLSCLRPAHEPGAIEAALHQAHGLGEPERSVLRARAREQVARHDLRRERRMFLEVLEGLDSLW